ncbi:MAG: hypothetical protein LAO21_08340 [Acidobacteriia bacterium]|nr:hypothetical protein [Terriglobia bacterium]
MKENTCGSGTAILLVHRVASTSGTGSDWVVKLIDVYLGELAGQPKIGVIECSCLTLTGFFCLPD